MVVSVFWKMILTLFRQKICGLKNFLQQNRKGWSKYRNAGAKIILT